MRRDYLIRYGLARAIGRFELTSGTLDRNQVVVIRSHRGTELGEVLAEAPPAGDDQAEAVPPPAPILRVALAEDFQRARAVELDRTAHFERCRAIFDEGTWPLELIDAEPLLDPGRTVLHYLGPHRLDARA